MFQYKKLTDENWTSLPEPKKEGMTITDEPIWAPNTGRGSDGTMIGDIVAWKTTVEVAWPPLSFSDSKAIADALKDAGAFFQIKYIDFSTSTPVTKTVYCSNVPRTVYSLAQAARRHLGITVTFVER